MQGRLIVPTQVTASTHIVLTPGVHISSYILKQGCSLRIYDLLVEPGIEGLRRAVASSTLDSLRQGLFQALMFNTAFA